LNDTNQLDTEKLDLVARMGASWYTRATSNSLFEIPKPIFNIKKAVKVTGDWYLRVEKKMRIQLKSPANK